MKNKKLLSLALALIMGFSVVPYSAFANEMNNTGNIELKVADTNEEKLAEQQKKIIEKLNVELDAALEKLGNAEDEKKSKMELKAAVPPYFMFASNDKEVDTAAEKAKEDLSKLIKMGGTATVSEIEYSLKKLENLKKLLENLENEGLNGKVNEIKVNEIKVKISELKGALESAQKAAPGMGQAMVKELNEYIDQVAVMKKQALKNKANETEETKDERKKIIEKIKDCDTVEELDDIYIPDKFKNDFEILLEKGKRKQKLIEDEDLSYTDYDKEEKIKVKNLSIEEDEDNRGMYIVSGNARKDHVREYISIFYEGRFVGGGMTDGDGYFEITVNEKVYDNGELVFRAGKEKYYTKDEVKISPWDIKITTNYVEGKYNKDTFIKVYYKGSYVGEGRTDKDGKFRIHCDRRISNIGDLEFYKYDKNNDSGNIITGSLKPGDIKITGNAPEYAEIIVRDNDDLRLGNVKADINGKFTVFLNRPLKAGEKLTITVREENRDEKNYDYTVGSIDSGNLVRKRYANGYNDGCFRGGAFISRAEAVMMLSRLINDGEDFNTPKVTKFEDAETGWYAQAINFVVDRGLMFGYPDGDFEPDSFITRAEFASMLNRYLKLDNVGNSGLKDVKNHWAKDAIETLYGHKMVKGYPDGTFKPEDDITRAEAVTVLNACFGRKSDLNSVDNITNPELLRTFRDVFKSDWYYAEVLDATNDHESYMNGDYEMWTSVK